MFTNIYAKYQEGKINLSIKYIIIKETHFLTSEVKPELVLDLINNLSDCYIQYLEGE